MGEHRKNEENNLLSLQMGCGWQQPHGVSIVGGFSGNWKEKNSVYRFVSNFRRGRIVSALVWNHPRQWALRTLLEDNFKTHADTQSFNTFIKGNQGTMLD